MVTNIFENAADQLIANQIITSEEKEIYIYGLQQGLIMILNIITTIAIGYLFKMVWQSILFMASYLPLRSFAGGYHARTQLRCFLFSMVLTSVELLVIRFIHQTNFIILGLAMMAGVIILLIAPVEDSNKPLDQIEIIVYKKLTRIILSVEICIVVLLLVFGVIIVPLCISVSLLVLSGMLIVGKIKERIQKY